MIDAPSEETHEFGSDHGETAIPLISKGLFGDPVQGYFSPYSASYTDLFSSVRANLAEKDLLFGRFCG